MGELPEMALGELPEMRVGDSTSGFNTELSERNWGDARDNVSGAASLANGAVSL